MSNSNQYTTVVIVAEMAIVRSGVPKSFFSIGSLKNDAVCIEQNFTEGVAIVYDGLNGKKQNISTFSNPVLAAGDFIERVYSKFEEQSEKYHELLVKMCDQECRDISIQFEEKEEE